MSIFSDWFKVDLHIHTDDSRKTKTNDYQGNFDISELKQKLIENDVKLFSLTDHNIINVEAYKNYYTNYKQGDPKLLIGCEFDIEVPESGKTITYHSLLIFENETIEDVELISDKVENLFLSKGSVITDRKLTIDDLYDLFNDFNYFFIPHAGNTKSILDPYKGYDMKLCQQMVLLMPSAFEKVKESVRQIYNQGFDRLKEYDFQAKDDIPYINFSDNHNSHKYPCTNKNGEDHEFYCIKGKPSFESIRFAFIDPKSRIKKYAEVEELKRYAEYVRTINFNGLESVKDTEIFFSPNLNVIIGGRSSGKSLLFSVLGSKINSPKNNSKKYNLDLSKVKISGSLDSGEKSIISFNKGDLVYINQGDIVNYFENNSLKDLIQESGKEDSYKEALSFFGQKKQEFECVIDELMDIYEQFKNSVIANFTIHDKDIDSILDSSYYFKRIEDITDKTEQFSEANEILLGLDDYIEKFKKNDNWVFSSEENKTIEAFQTLVSEKSELFNLDKVEHLRKVSFIEEVKELINNQNATLDTKGREKDSANSRLRSLKGSLREILNLALKFANKCKELESYGYNFKREIIINDDVAVVLEIQEQEDSIKDLILAGLSPVSNAESLYDNLLKVVNDDIKIKNYPDNTVNSLKKKVNSQVKKLKEAFDKPIEFLKYSESSTSKNNSPGYNSEKYLETILKNGKSKIILIDQPEDNLGNKFISENLIDILRELKFEKQIFLVTHNPSIVVYGDAENVIMATNNSNQIEYKQFVLEEKEHQVEICNTLDGGRYIFEQRARKYNIKKLI
ncbi:PHP domain-containing protein [Formosa sp. A9]|uniref:PHP domain-containing protein n=1 Tax=Formosa sp. A9 TaxID=3442641 RepID=UPI003EB71FFA